MDKIKVTKAMAAVNAAGVTVPQEVRDVETRLGLAVNKPTVTEAEQRVGKARTQEDLDAAVAALAEAVAVASAADSPEFNRAVSRVRGEALGRTLVEYVPGVLAELGAKYADAAEPFTDAVNRIPDIAGVSPLDFSEDTTKALADARRAVDPLNAVYAAYDALALMIGLGRAGRNREGSERIAERIGEYDTEGQEDQAAEFILGYARNAPELALGRLAPHVAVARVGGTLRLAGDLI